MESSLRYLLNDMAEHRPILKITKKTYHLRFVSTPKTGIAITETGVLFLMWSSKAHLQIKVVELNKRVRCVDRYGMLPDRIFLFRGMRSRRQILCPPPLQELVSVSILIKQVGYISKPTLNLDLMSPAAFAKGEFPNSANKTILWLRERRPAVQRHFLPWGGRGQRITGHGKMGLSWSKCSHLCAALHRNFFKIAFYILSSLTWVKRGRKPITLSFYRKHDQACGHVSKID